MIENLSIVFPMFNERAYVRDAIIKMSDVLKDITNDYEIIIVDDASRDESGQIAEELSRHMPYIKVARHKKNRKLGGSLKTGFNLATKKLILYSDMDMPFDFMEIKRAVHILIEDKADLVSAYRLNRFDDGFRRYLYSSAYDIFLKVLFGLDVRDVNFSFKLMRSDFLKKIHLRSEGSFIDAEMLIKARRLHAKIAQFGVRYFPRLNGSSRLSTFGVIFKILKEAFAFRLGFLK